MRFTSRTMVAVALVAGAAAVVVAQTAPQKPTAPSGTSVATAAAGRPDLTGEWLLDASRSDKPPQRGAGFGASDRSGGGGGRRWVGGGGGGMRGGGGMGGGGGAGGGGYRRGFGGRPHDGSGTEDSHALRPLRLPARIHITQTARIVSVEDSSGVVIEEIATVPAAADTFDRPPGAVHVLGEWKDQALEMTRETPDGGSRVETWSLIDGGASLVSEVKVEGGGIPERSFKRVFKRVSEP